jgi:hypothetical protein
MEELVCNVTLGSGNGLAAHIGCINPVMAAYYIIKGDKSPMDIASVSYQNKRQFIFLR